jgi:signal transduction histidine kinase
MVPDFLEVPSEELEWLASRLTLRPFRSGDILYRQDEAVLVMYIVLSGELEYVRREGGKEVTSFPSEPGEIGGLLPFSRMQVNGATVTALTDGQIAELHRDAFGQLQQNVPTILQRLVNEMLDRTRDYTRINEQRERLTSLGRLSAGLAHELNNPASAAKRAADTLAETLQRFDEHASSLLKPTFFALLPAAGDPFEPIYQAINPDVQLGTLERADREDALTDWLMTQGVADAWTLASVLVSAGLTRELLEQFSQQLVPERINDFLIWLAYDVQMRLLSRELIESTRRMSELVQAMKAYSYMDQGQGKQPTDIHAGINNTLMILRHKLDKKAIAVERDYGEIPAVETYGGELNQVWTNLLANAIDALSEGGRITIKTGLDVAGQELCVDITDNGVGIPAEVQGRIFEPFFTTKAAGEGTGLGLDIVNRIIMRHRGAIRVSSQPGHTRFSVRLPVNL